MWRDKEDGGVDFVIVMWLFWDKNIVWLVMVVLVFFLIVVVCYRVYWLIFWVELGLGRWGGWRIGGRWGV